MSAFLYIHVCLLVFPPILSSIVSTHDILVLLGASILHGRILSANGNDILALSKAFTFQYMIWNDGAFLAVVVVGVFDVVNAKVIEARNSQDIEQ